MRELGKHIRKWLCIKPLSVGWKGAVIAVASMVFVVVIVQSYYMFADRGLLDTAIGAIVALVAVALIGAVIAGFVHILKKMPTRYIWLFFSSFILLFISFLSSLFGTPIIVILMIFICSLWGALVYRLLTGSIRHYKSMKRLIVIGLSVVTTVIIAFGGYWLVSEGNEIIPGANLKELRTSERYANNSMDNPTEEGGLSVKKITYGNKESYRKEFNQSDSLSTKSVDGSHFVKKWSSLRTKRVHFGPDEMPLNGFVFYPEGKGPFPLVVMAHGNHMMDNYSDTGYDYLGELLASRGYIFVSIDENFLNGSPYDDLFIFNALEEENPARGLLILEHLKTWSEWNNTADNPFYRKVDMDQIALIGHSRGGEAISIAAAFNKLNAHPDNGNIKFDYNFNIRSLISIAGTDAQYKPMGKELPLNDVNYLVLHGAHDMDVTTFQGSKQYNRLHFTGQEEVMKSSVYIYGANHGQFNTSWGRGDTIGLGNRLFNLKQLMTPEEQEMIAKVFISSFLDATLKQKIEYRELFKDIGYAQQWLPDTMYISNYADSKTMLLASFNEDIDLHSTTIVGGKAEGENLLEWREERIKKKGGEDLYGAVRLGWDRSKNANIASYSIVLPNDGIILKSTSSFVFSMADINKQRSGTYNDRLIDLSIKVEDRNGNAAKLPLSYFSKLVPMIEGRLLKWPLGNLGNISEPVFQNYGFKLSDFQKVNKQLDPLQIVKFSFVMDQTKEGVILINDIGISN